MKLHTFCIIPGARKFDTTLLARAACMLDKRKLSQRQFDRLLFFYFKT